MTAATEEADSHINLKDLYRFARALAEWRQMEFGKNEEVYSTQEDVRNS